jgi:hypothetical protein
MLAGIFSFLNINYVLAFGNEVAPGTPGGEVYNPPPPETPPSEKGSRVASFVNQILYLIASAFGWILGKFVLVMVFVANYNNFGGVTLVNQGWSIIRDLCNNFFIIILLVIAVGTILRVPNYQYKQILPRLLIMAVLINFSKMFTLLLIDFSQVLTLFFASAFQEGEQGVALILGAIGLYKLYQLKAPDAWTPDKSDLADWDISVALVFAIILSVVACVVVAMITIVLIYRIVMLWFLIILSPAAFFGYTFSQGQKYWTQWWGELSRYLIVGPVMLFFLYVSFFSGFRDTTTGIAGSPAPGAAVTVEGLSDNTSEAAVKKAVQETESKMADPDQFFGYLIIIGLMVGSLYMGQLIGTKGSEWAGKGMGWLKNAAKKGASPIAALPKAVGWGAGRAGAWGMEKSPIPLVKQWGADIGKKMDKTAQKRAGAFMEKLGMGGKTKEFIAERKGAFERATRAAGVATGGAAGVAGAATGAMIGSVVLPGLGTVIGGVAGAALGGLLGFLRKPGKHIVAHSVDESKEITNAKQNVTNAKNDASFMKDSSGSLVYSSSGQTSAQKKFFDQLASGSNSDAAAARTQIEHWIKGTDEFSGGRGFDASKDGDISKLRAWAKGLAAYKKGKNNDAPLANIKAAIDAQVSVVGNPADLEKVDDYESKVTAATLVDTGEQARKYEQTKQRLAEFKNQKGLEPDKTAEEAAEETPAVSMTMNETAVKAEGQKIISKEEAHKRAEEEFWKQNANKEGMLDRNAFEEQQRMENWYQKRGEAEDVSAYNKFARGGNTLAVNLEELDFARIAQQAGANLSAGDAEQIKSAVGLNLGTIKDEKILTGVQGKLKEMMQTNINNLEANLTKAQASGQAVEMKFGGQAVQWNEKQIQEQLNKAKAAMAGLGDIKRIGRLELLDNSRGGRDKIAHEASHTTLETLDNDRQAQRKVFENNYNEQERAGIIADQRRKTKNAGLSESQAMNEHFVELMTNKSRGRVAKGSKEEAVLSDLANNLNARAAEINPELAMDQEAAPTEKAAAKRAVAEAEPTVVNNINNISQAAQNAPLSAALGVNNFLDPASFGSTFLLLRQTISKLNTTLDRLPSEMRAAMGSLADKIVAMNRVLPPAGDKPTLIEVKAALADKNINEDDFNKFVKEITELGEKK